MLKILTALLVITSILKPNLFSNKKPIAIDTTKDEIIMEGELPDFELPKLTTLDARSPIDEPHYKNHQQDISMRHIGDIEKVWDSYTGEGITIAVIDCAGSYYHEEFWKDGVTKLSNRSAYIWAEVNQSTSSFKMHKEEVGTDFSNAHIIDPDIDTDNHCPYHGISVAATAAAAVNGVGGAGIAPDATVLALKIDMTFMSINTAIEYAVDVGADVINMSLGANGVDQEVLDYVQPYIDYAYENNVIVCASAGNEENNYLTAPCACDHVLGVGALERGSSSVLADFSNYNSSLTGPYNSDIVAPGYVYTAKQVENNVSKYTEIQGTSFSCPIMAGVAALYKQKNPNCNQDDFEADLYATAVDLGDVGFDVIFGNGAVDVGALLLDGEDLEWDDTTTKNQDSTDIYWKDEIGWLFRTLELKDLGFYAGYTISDFENYLNIEIGNHINRSSYQLEGTTKCWAYATEGVKNDYLINLGGTEIEHTIHLPWWVINGYYKFLNNSNTIFDQGVQYIASVETYGTTTNLHYKASLKNYIYNNYGNAANSLVVTPGCTYDFKAITVTKKVLYLNGSTDTVINTKTETSCIYDLYHKPSKASISGYSITDWYADQNLTAEYVRKVLRKDTTIYAVATLNDEKLYATWSESDGIYVYEKYVDGLGREVEPFGPRPGTLMKMAEDAKFCDQYVYRIDFPLKSLDDDLAEFEVESDTLVDGSIVMEYGTSWIDMDEYYIYECGAIDLFWDINEARLAVPSNGNIKEGSFCGISQQDAQDLIDRYEALDSDEKTLLGSAIVNTYKKDKTSGKEWVEFSDILDLLNRIATGNSSQTNFYLSLNQDSSIILITTIALTTLFGLAIICLRRKKQQ